MCQVVPILSSLYIITDGVKSAKGLTHVNKEWKCCMLAINGQRVGYMMGSAHVLRERTRVRTRSLFAQFSISYP